MVGIRNYLYALMLGSLLYTIQWEFVKGQYCNGDFEFRCSNLQCIYDGYRCDKETDCTDNSDEQNCPIPTCGGILTASSGVISSPNYPRSYPNNAKCTWIIQGAEKSFMHVDFTGFSLQRSEYIPAYGGDVCYDWLQVQEIKEDNPGAACGTDLDSLQFYLGNYLWIHFRSDEVTGGTGFRMEYEIIPCTDDRAFRCDDGGCVSFLAECDGTADCDDNSDEQNCLTRECNAYEFRCAVPNNRRCIRDSEKCDGLDDCADKADEMNCNTACSGEFDHSCANGQCIYDGFECDTEHDCRDNSDELSCPVPSCGGQLTASTGVIRSPNYPSDYPSNAKCTWIIQGSQNTYIKLRFAVLNLQEPKRTTGTTHYCYDWVEVFETKLGGYDDGTIFCGYETSESYTSTGNYLWVQFRSDAAIVDSGFRLEYSIVSGSPPSNAGSSGSSGSSGSPGSSGGSSGSSGSGPVPNGGLVVLLVIIGVAFKKRNCGRSSF